MICIRCGENKPVIDFPVRENGYLRKSCKECWTKHRTDYKREWREKNLDRDFKNRKEWKEKNPEYLKLYNRKKRKEDVNFKIAGGYRCRVYSALKSNQKTGKTMDVLGCSVEELRIYLEKKFQEGMSWNNYNYNGWHIDHIKPCSLFDLSIPEEQKKCFHYTNLQPLWAKDNFKKSSTFIGGLENATLRY
jgi:hypothetical protein